MKKLLFALACVTFLGACNKDVEEPVVVPEANTWVVNTNTYGPITASYNDTTNAFGGKKAKVGAAYCYFRFKPKEDGTYILREKADELNEVSIVLADSTTNDVWYSIDNDGQPAKRDQTVDVKVKGNSVSVQFTNRFFRRSGSTDLAKVSMNLNP